MEELLMSTKEIDRFFILSQVQSKQITQVKAAQLLGITDRQVRNLLKQLKKFGKKGLISKKRGNVSNRSKDKPFRERVLKTLNKHYEGFGPTLAQEKLKEQHQIDISRETLRQWMIQWHIWVPRKIKKRTYLPRNRRECFGELIQIDGSHHAWFGDVYPKAVLIVFIDDATGCVTNLHFCEQETLNGYFESLESHLTNYGRPRALYSDQFRIFKGYGEKISKTQFQIALDKLDIELIFAGSPQAKGRVERVNRTLQDRLVKELKLMNIHSIEEANKFLPRFLETFNEKFSKEPVSCVNAHRPLENTHDLKRILCRYEERALSKDGIFQFKNRFYKIEGLFGRLNHKKIEVRETKTGKIRTFIGTKELVFKLLNEVKQPKTLDSKQKLYWQPKKQYIPPNSHPWKGPSYRQYEKKKVV